MKKELPSHYDVCISKVMGLSVTIKRLNLCLFGRDFHGGVNYHIIRRLVSHHYLTGFDR